MGFTSVRHKRLAVIWRPYYYLQLRETVIAGSNELVRTLLVSQGDNMDCDCRTLDLKTPLILACENGYLDVAETLLALGARIDLRDVCCSHVWIFLTQPHVFISSPFQLDSSIQTTFEWPWPQKEGMTALHYSAWKQSLGMTRLLLASRAVRGITDKAWFSVV